MNQMPGSIPQPPTDVGMGEIGGGMTPPPPPSGGSMGEGSGDEHPHEQILAALARIEGKLDLIATKVGA